jgi:hypothetical protein
MADIVVLAKRRAWLDLKRRVELGAIQKPKIIPTTIQDTDFGLSFSYMLRTIKLDETRS